MKKLVLLSIGIAVVVSQNAFAQYQTNVLFTTANDWSLWTGNGATVAVDPTFSSDNNTVNGLGNTGGGIGTGNGSLAITRTTSGNFNEIGIAPSQGGNSAFLLAVDPGSNPGASVSAAYSGTFQLTYSLLSPGVLTAGTYFQLGLQMQYNANGYYGPVFWSSTTDLGYTDPNGNEMFQATIPYTINAGNFFGFGFGLMINSDYQSPVPFYLDEITSLTPTPEPTTMALVGMGALGFTFFARRRRA